MTMLRWLLCGAVFFSLAGCGACFQKSQEMMMEKALEEQAGGEAEVDIDGGTVRVKTEEGEAEFGQGAEVEVPEDVKAQFVLYPGATPQNYMKMPEGTSVMLKTSDAVGKVMDFYRAQFNSGGWQVMEQLGPQGGHIGGLKDEQTLNVNIMDMGDQGTMITLVRASHPDRGDEPSNGDE